MEFLRFDMIRTSAVDLLGFVACAATLLTFTQKRMWPMRISAIAANLFFIGYGALGLLYPVLFLHLALLPLNVFRLIQLAEPGKAHQTPEPDLARPSLAPRAPKNTVTPPPFGGGQWQARAGNLSARSIIWDSLRSDPP